MSEKLNVGEVGLGGGVADACRVVAGTLVHRAGELGPVDDFAGVRHVVGAVFRAREEQVQSSSCQILGEGRATPLVGDHGRVDAALCQGGHGTHKVLAGTDNPAGAQGVVLTPRGGGNLTGCLGCAVDAQRCQGVILRVFLAQGQGAVEDVVGGHVHQRQVGFLADGGERAHAQGVGCPGFTTTLGGLGLIHGGVGRSVDDRAEGAPAECVTPLLGLAQVEAVAIHSQEGYVLLGELANQLGTELTASANNQDRVGFQGLDLVQTRVVTVLLGELSLRQIDGPVDCDGLIGKVQEAVAGYCVRRPVVVHQVGVGGVLFQGLEGVTHAAGHEDCGVRAQLHGDDLAEGLAGTQINPRTEDTTGRNRNVLIPRLGVDTAGGTYRSVERNVVLHRVEVGQTGCDHLLALPIFLEPAAVIAVNRQVNDEQAGNLGFSNLQFLGHYWPAFAYFASTSAFRGSHQPRLSVYHLMVSARPDSKSVNFGSQPSSARRRLPSIA